MSPYPDDLDELLGAYALDAVDDDERRQVDAYLAANPRARAEVEQHREVATLLAMGGGPAPGALWDRIAAALDEPAPAPGPELAKVLAMSPAELPGRATAPTAGPVAAPAADRARRRWWPVAVGGIAAALLIGVLGGMVLDRQREVDRLRAETAAGVMTQAFGQAVADPASTKVLLKAPSGDGPTAEAVVGPNGRGFVSGSSLPALPDDRTYQLWGVVDGKVISLGVLGPRPDVAPFSVSGTLSALVLTNEVAGGVPVSKEQPALAGTVTR